MALKPAYDVVVPGSYYCDLIFTGLPALPQLGAEIFAPQFDIILGGGAINTSIALQRLGINVGLATELGSDMFSGFVAERLAAEGIDPALLVHLDSPLRRVTVALSYPHDRAFVSYTDPGPVSAERVARVLDSTDFRHLHLPGLTLSPLMLTVLDRCHMRGISVSMDCQHREETLEIPLVREIIRRADIFMPNETEALRLTGASSVTQALDALSQLASTVVIKRGAAGVIARGEGIDYQIAALPVEALDTTGAGDVFNAGFLAAYLEQSAMSECLHWGNYCGGMSVRGLGGTSTAPLREHLVAWWSAQNMRS